MFVDIASVGFTFLFVFLAFVLGFALQFVLEMTEGVGSTLIGVAETIAGGSSRSEPKGRNKIALFARILFYLALIVSAFILAASGFSGYAAACGIFGSLALGMAAVKLFSR
jgi:hypothetical protein